MQIMPYEDAANYRFNPFDLTKVWPHSDYPPITVGRMVLDRNPENHFAEVEQAGFAPAKIVPGIGLSPDKMLMGRIFSYHDTHLYRLGANYEQLPINAPKCPVHTYNKDGAMAYRHSGAQPVYAPNSYGGPVPDPSKELPTWAVEAAEIGRYPYVKHAEDDDFVQPRALYREVMNDTDREHLATNIVAHASDGVTPEMQSRVIAYWTNVDAALGAVVAAGLGHTNGADGAAGARPAASGATQSSRG
jgi:catalase